ncbi:response regulator [Actinosynnema sp. NPDC047251]|uniref:Transcriptional regulator, KdpE family n=1 Tax=Saccharothrix espanaensis (strain ATCC 51144 / DSM 44229 / JCM 9112 / NBRC 15066 / NRRL 15764) TaxID=1179773 RepID=K0K9D6_SACES|nr:response regulator [Saccharothrix espanaensis]CCH33228.1 Transcriptional regulator, KdpE family [Saccharothrix espanaensis DSM 44229]
MTSVLVVDDDPQIVRALRITLKAHGYHVLTAHDGASALAEVDGRPDVILLDLGLPDMDGVAVIAALRERVTTPIVVLSARADAHDKIAALDAGADDYVTKPFGVDELLARLRAAVRRTGPRREGEPPVLAASFTVDLNAKRVRRDGAEVHLTRTEWALLEVLVRAGGEPVSVRDLLDRVWGAGYYSQTHYLRVYLAQLRRKLEPEPSHPRHLLTAPGLGYLFRP